MTNNTNKKKSAARKLLPAVSMLTVSAVMLSTATYAWFTMNKTVEVKGLTLSATVSDGLEITGGEVVEGVATNGTPSSTSVTWKRNIAISDYYDGIAKLKPASSATALTMYKVDEEGVYAGGREVNDDAAITANPDKAKVTLGNYMNNTFTPATDETNAGYYIDLPFWIRTSNSGGASTGTPIYCNVTIGDPDTAVSGTASGTDLQKAVRVAIIPLASSTNNTSPTYTPADTITAIMDESSQKIFGKDNTMYNHHSGTADALSGGATYSAATWGTQSVTPDEATVFTIPKGADNCYGQVMFIARVWLEGESTSCWDANANQDWNIDLKFSTEATPAPAG